MRVSKTTDNEGVWGWEHAHVNLLPTHTVLVVGYLLFGRTHYRFKKLSPPIKLNIVANKGW